MKNTGFHRSNNRFASKWRYAGLVVLVLIGAYFGVDETGSDKHTGPFTLQGQVVRVADGDTITLRLANNKQQRVRLASIDAPEAYKNPQQPGQPYAMQSQKFLANLLNQQQHWQLHCYEYDLYDRAVCDIPLPQGGTANQKLVEQGLAWANREKKSQFLRDKSMVQREQEAQQHQRGLWSVDGAVAPWQWRYSCWKQGQC